MVVDSPCRGHAVIRHALRSQKRSVQDFRPSRSLSMRSWQLARPTGRLGLPPRLVYRSTLNKPCHPHPMVAKLSPITIVPTAVLYQHIRRFPRQIRAPWPTAVIRASSRRPSRLPGDHQANNGRNKKKIKRKRNETGKESVGTGDQPVTRSIGLKISCGDSCEDSCEDRPFENFL